MELRGKHIRSRTNLCENFSIREVWEQVWEFRKGYENFLTLELSPVLQVDRTIRNGFTEDGWHRKHSEEGDWFSKGQIDTQRLEQAIRTECASLGSDFWQDNREVIRTLAEQVSRPAAEEKSDLLWLFLLLHIQACARVTKESQAFFKERLKELDARCQQGLGFRYEEQGRRLVADGSKRRIVLPLCMEEEEPPRIAWLTNPGFFPVQIQLGNTAVVRTLFHGESIRLLCWGEGYVGFLPRIPAAQSDDLPSPEVLWSGRAGEHSIRLSPEGVATIDGLDECWAEPVSAVALNTVGALVAAGRVIYHWSFASETFRQLTQTDLPAEELRVEEQTLWYRTQGSSTIYTLTIPEDGGNEDVFDP